ncbi:MAG: PhoX family protein [Egibacteraceae bacterium]
MNALPVSAPPLGLHVARGGAARVGHPQPNWSADESFLAAIARALSRSAAVKGGMAAALVLATACTTRSPRKSAVMEANQQDRTYGAGRPLTFTPVQPNVIDDVIVPEGYGWDVLLRWGDPLTDRAPAFDFQRQTPEAQAGQFGYNCDFLAVLRGEDGELVLWANHESPTPALMFPDLDPQAPTERQVDIEIAALGGSVVALRRCGRDRYEYVPGHRLNRRITGDTPMLLTGPAAGSPLLRTGEDPTGTRVRGTFENCGGGVTPWGTVLTCEENVTGHFANLSAVTDPRLRALHSRMGVPTGQSTLGWELHHRRFDLAHEPHEPFRFGWVVEVDPFDPSYTPRKRTAMGRFKHEDANPRIVADGRVAFYMGDDEDFEYVYKFVTARRMERDDRDRDLLDDGVLHVARFFVDECGDKVGEWIPLVHGQRGLTAENGFASQAEVVVNARGAADVVGATPMDRPEDIEMNPVTGTVYIALTRNTQRGTAGRLGPVPANPRPVNRTGHVIELIEDGNDAAAERFTWRIFLLCGDPGDPSTYFAGFPKDQVSPIAGPDNIAFDRDGNLWIATDGQSRSLNINNAFHAVPVEGEDRGHVRMFASVPCGAEATGPTFSPDGRTLFGAVQHPGEGGTLEAPISDWPDRMQPPRPSVVTFWKDPGDSYIGS